MLNSFKQDTFFNLIAAPEATGYSLLEEKWGSEELTGLFKVAQQINRRVWIQVSIQHSFPGQREPIPHSQEPPSKNGMVQTSNHILKMLTGPVCLSLSLSVFFFFLSQLCSKVSLFL